MAQSPLSRAFLRRHIGGPAHGLLLSPESRGRRQAPRRARGLPVRREFVRRGEREETRRRRMRRRKARRCERRRRTRRNGMRRIQAQRRRRGFRAARRPPWGPGSAPRPRFRSETRRRGGFQDSGGPPGRAFRGCGGHGQARQAGAGAARGARRRGGAAGARNGQGRDLGRRRPAPTSLYKEKGGISRPCRQPRASAPPRPSAR